MKDSRKTGLPLVYSCSGCSNVAQLSNDIAIQLDREKIAEMSCIAGLGGSVPSIVKKARSGRTIIALDGCHLHCAKNCLALHGLVADHHYILTGFGIRKQYQSDCQQADADEIKKIIMQDIGNSAPESKIMEDHNREKQ